MTKLISTLTKVLWILPYRRLDSNDLVLKFNDSALLKWSLNSMFCQCNKIHIIKIRFLKICIKIFHFYQLWSLKCSCLQESSRESKIVTWSIKCRNESCILRTHVLVCAYFSFSRNGIFTAWRSASNCRYIHGLLSCSPLCAHGYITSCLNGLVWLFTIYWSYEIACHKKLILLRIMLNGSLLFEECWLFHQPTWPECMSILANMGDKWHLVNTIKENGQKCS